MEEFKKEALDLVIQSCVTSLGKDNEPNREYLKKFVENEYVRLDSEIEKSSDRVEEISSEIVQMTERYNKLMEEYRPLFTRYKDDNSQRLKFGWIREEIKTPLFAEYVVQELKKVLSDGKF